MVDINRCLPGDSRRVAKATGATMVLTLADMEGNETFDASALGTADEVRLHGSTIYRGGTG